jgi:hypothetical protein
VHIDLEGSGGKLQTLSGVCAFGFYGVDETQQEVLAYEVAVQPLVCDDPEQIATYWETDANRAAWKRIVEARRPRLEVAAEIKAVFGRLSELGWKAHIFARPASYDFRELTTFFESLGVAILSERIAKLSPEARLRQMVCGFDLDLIGSEACDPRGKMVSPFGFGGASQVTDIGQQIAGMCIALGISPPPFNSVMKAVIGRSQLAHGGLQDAKDQAATWYAVLANARNGTLVQFFHQIALPSGQ